MAYLSGARHPLLNCSVEKQPRYTHSTYQLMNLEMLEVKYSSVRYISESVNLHDTFIAYRINEGEGNTNIGFMKCNSMVSDCSVWILIYPYPFLYTQGKRAK